MQLRASSLHSHDHYKELSALAVSGQLRPSERDEVQHHLAACDECRSELQDFSGIVASLQAVSDNQSPIGVPAGATERFLARARSEGIPLGRKVQQPLLLKSVSRHKAIGIATCY